MKKTNYRSFLKVSSLLKFICLSIFLIIPADSTFAMQANLPFAEIAQSADIIFAGTVESRDSYFNPQQTLIFTEVIFSDISVVHSTNRSAQKNLSSIILKYAGGCVGELCLSVSSAPSFRLGHRYLLCIGDDGKTYINPVIGGSQGFFEVVKDVRTGTEFLLTAGKKVVLKTNAQEFTRSKLPVSYIQGGFPVYDKSREDHFGQFSAAAPAAKDPADSASLSLPGYRRQAKTAQALKFADFIRYIKDTALQTPLKKRRLRLQGLGSLFINKSQAATPAKRTAPPAHKGGQSEGSAIPGNIEQVPFEYLINRDKQGETGFQGNEQTRALHGETGTGLPNAGERVLAAPAVDTPQGGQLGYCGYHSLPFNMERVPDDWWSYDSLNFCLNTWNRFMDVYRKKNSDGKFGHNDKNEFCGWVDDSTMANIYGVNWNGYLAWAHSWWRSTPCGLLIESDVLFNPSYDWTDDESFAIGNEDVILLKPVAMHELAHTWGMQRGEEGDWGYHETYDYDRLTVVHQYYYHIVENGRGIHRADAYCFRRLYDNWTDIIEIVDVGVESYYADDGLHNSTANASSYYPGDSISLNNITVENNSYNEVEDVRVRFYLSTDRNITTNDYKIGSYWNWETFDGESRSVFDISSDIPADIPAGTYYIGVIITINGYEQDDFTENNKTSFYLTITIKTKSSDGNGDDNPSKKCFIATAAFNSVYHPYVQVLRDFRDTYLMRSEFGRRFVNLYYKYSPPLADLISKHEFLRFAVRNSLMPLVAICGIVLQ
ncbi:MAG: hypothetical protein KAW12_17820 [Candidatus Aminicenantes bacterium]|nr:hypothetical protein [Candidatus Aminicenantes bacterium]